MKGSRIALLLVASLIFPCLLAAGLARADQFDSARLRIRNVITAHNIPSVTVAVALEGKIVWEEGFGWADIEKRIPATPHTAYSLASISKPVTATALMILVERGAIDLDKPMNTYLGEQKLSARMGSAGDATVRRVASHTSGLPLHARFFYMDESGSPPPMEETIRRYGVLVNPPGESFVYSNLGYGLIEYALERASRKSYADFIGNELFVPLGLRESAVNYILDAPNHVATRYWGDHIVPWYDFDTRGSGAVLMSAHDLVRFGMFHLHGRLEGQRRTILESRTLTSMRQESALSDGSPVGYAIGWFVGEQHGLRYFGHNGGMAGVASVLSIYPEVEAVIVVLANGVSRAGAVHSLEGDIVHALFPETIRKDHGFKPLPELIGRWKGFVETYNGRIPVELDFKESGSVFARVGTSPVQEVVKVEIEPKTSRLRLDDLVGEIGTAEARLHPGPLQLSLRLRAPNTLNGAISSNSLETLSDRMGNAVSYWIELHRN